MKIILKVFLKMKINQIFNNFLNNIKSFFIITILSIVISDFAFANEKKIEEAKIHVLTFWELVDEKTNNFNLSDEEKKAAITKVIDEFFDVKGIIRFSAGRYWKTATSEEKEIYSNLLKKIFYDAAIENFHRLGKIKFIYKNTELKGKKIILVNGIIKDQANEIPDTKIALRLSSVPNKPTKIFDVEIENISMLITQQQENTSIIRQNGGKFSALIDALKVKFDKKDK